MENKYFDYSKYGGQFAFRQELSKNSPTGTCYKPVPNNSKTTTSFSVLLIVVKFHITAENSDDWAELGCKNSLNER